MIINGLVSLLLCHIKEDVTKADGGKAGVGEGATPDEGLCASAGDAGFDCHIERRLEKQRYHLISGRGIAGTAVQRY